MTHPHLPMYKQYRSIADCIRKSVRNDGVRSLWRGAGLRVCLWSPQFAVSLFTYEALQRNLFPDIIPVPPTHVPVNSRDFMALRTERLSQRLHKVWIVHGKHAGVSRLRVVDGVPRVMV